VVPSLDEIPGDVTGRRTIHHHVDVVPVPANGRREQLQGFGEAKRKE
jgi:hypothetical protein